MKKKFALLLTTIILLMPLVSCRNEASTNTLIKDIQLTETKKVLNENYQTKVINKKTTIETLTSDNFEGRAIGSNGNMLTEDYIYKLFKDIGLCPLFNLSLIHI